LNWSPEQIAGWLKRAHPEDERYHVSHETIYRSLYIQARGVLKKELLHHLGDKRGQIADLVSISRRPATVEDRAVPGHWEGDLLSGSNNSYIATLVERHTRYVTLAKVANKDTQTVVPALIKQAKTMPNELYRSLTWEPPLSGASVLSASRLEPLAPFPLASPARFSRSIQEPD
jgi:IS30 family transposase